jgi:AraC family transcriptional regulator of arabinose operon
MNSRIEQIISELNASYRSEISVDKLAQSVGLSPSRLQHLFKGETGMSIGQYVKNLRLQTARRLLETTYLRIQEVYLAVGINDASLFVREFKKTFGKTPTEYRKNFRIAEKSYK